MKQVKTGDDSVTYHNPKYDETYHSTSGAVEEAFEKFVKPCKIKERSKEKDSIKVLDICFGLGYNSCAAIDATECKIFITALENDEEIIHRIKEVDPQFENYSLLKELIRTKPRTHAWKLSTDKVNIKLILGDAREEIKELKNKFDCIFLDPFSPKKCPELWTKEFMQDIYNVTAPGGILATYSCAKSVRDNLKEAGFKVEDGPCIGRKSPSTIATKQ
jgi:tRNA U34 5-methylaminomethyl-2-thiouridine-forming methyltransferase MnmC